MAATGHTILRTPATGLEMLADVVREDSPRAEIADVTNTTHARTGTNPSVTIDRIQSSVTNVYNGQHIPHTQYSARDNAGRQNNGDLTAMIQCPGQQSRHGPTPSGTLRQ